MNNAFVLLLASTFSVGLVHTLLGPDHYLPFVALSRSRNWSLTKTVGITTVCGLGHILSAAALGLLAALFGNFLGRLEAVESIRGYLAAWFLILFGAGYAVWGLAAGNRHRPSERDERREFSAWILFLIFVFGPCEPLIPLMMYPAVRDSAARVLAVVLIFGTATLAAMLFVVIASVLGMKRLLRHRRLDRWSHPVAGGIICCCGLAMVFLGL